MYDYLHIVNLHKYYVYMCVYTGDLFDCCQYTVFHACMYVCVLVGVYECV